MLPMPADDPAEAPQQAESPAKADDAFLLASLAGGDEAALSALMDRHDRLVRYTIFRVSRDRCRSDPQWLDAVASASWAGFVGSIRQADTPPQSARAYLARIAHNQAVSALRGVRGDPTPVDAGSLETLEDDSTNAEPMAVLARLESLETLKSCVDELDADDRTLMAQLGPITERRWREAAEALGIKESTLRSRWSRVLERLRAAMQQKTGDSFAPPGPGGD